MTPRIYFKICAMFHASDILHFTGPVVTVVVEYDGEVRCHRRHVCSRKEPVCADLSLRKEPDDHEELHLPTEFFVGVVEVVEMVGGEPLGERGGSGSW